MTLLSPLKVRLTPWLVLMALLTLTMSPFIVQATESVETTVDMPKVSAAEKAID
ncbi:hypothetical protein VCHENC02_4472, partial [Vibrio harveyi]